MEIFDIVDEKGLPTGERISRTEAHQLGVRHRTAHVWVVRRKEDTWQVLLQKRAANKESFPGCFDTSSAGHIQAGEEPLPSACRELEEELGICAQPEDLELAGTFAIHYQKVFHGNLFKDNEISFVFIYSKPVNPGEIHVQLEELESTEWFDLDQVAYMCDHREETSCCVPLQGFQICCQWCLKQQ